MDISTSSETQALQLPLVTVGVPTYNRPNELRRCINELIAQTYPNIEILVSDNCSPDPRVARILSEISKNKHVRVFRQTTNIGALPNFQFLLNEAQGEYFMWAGDDDFRDPKYVSTLIDGFSRVPHASVSFCDFCECSEDGVRSGHYPDHLPLLRAFEDGRRWTRLLRFFWQYERFGKANLIYGLYRRSVLRGHKWQEFIEKHGSWGSDMLFAFKILINGPAVIATARLYRCAVDNPKTHTENIAHQGMLQGFRARLVRLREMFVYAFQYAKLAPFPDRILIAACLPAKLIAITTLTASTSLHRRLIRKWDERCSKR